MYVYSYVSIKKVRTKGNPLVQGTKTFCMQ